MEENKSQMQDLKQLKGAIGKKRDKSKAKQMGVKSTLVTDGGLAISSFYETVGKTGKKIPNVEVIASADGSKIYRENYRALNKAEIEPDVIQVYATGDETTLANPTKRLGADYIGIKGALEEKFFGKKCPNDNVHVQIAYNILDVKKHLIQFVNQIIYTFYNVNRVTIDYETFIDVIGTLYAFEKYSRQDFSKVKCVDEIEKLLSGVSFIDAYFPGVFKLPQKNKKGEITEQEKSKCDEYNFDVLRLLSVIRQACEHESLKGHTADYYLYNIENELGNRNQELLQFLDELYKKVPEKFNKEFEENAKNNLYILTKLYPQENFNELVKKYYSYVAIKEQNNVGVNLRFTREIIIERFYPQLKDKKYDTYRNKIYTVLGYVLFESVKGSELLAKTVEKLRKNATEEGRLQIYLDFATEVWNKNANAIKTVVSEFEKEKENKFHSAPNQQISVVNKEYAIGNQNASYFAKEMLLLTKFLDGKEINILLTGLISRFDNIADLIDCATECGVNIKFSSAYEFWSDARAVANELRIINNVAKMKGESASVKNCMLIDAVNFLGLEQPILHWIECTTDEQRAINKSFLARIQPPAQKGEKVNHQLRNFIINNVVKSRWFFYLARYTKPSVVRKVMQSEKLVRFVLNEIPDAQIVRYYKSVSGYDPDNITVAKNYLTKRLSSFTIDKLMDDIESWDSRENRSTNEKSVKQKSRAMVGLYLTVAYLAIKGVTSVNSVFSIAFSCLERDVELKRIDEDNSLLLLTQTYLDEDKILVEKYNAIRDRIRDDETLSKEEKRIQYARLIPLKKQMHYDLHGYYCVRNNYEESKSLTRIVYGNEIHPTKEYRNVVAHLNVSVALGDYIGEMKKITSYYSIFVYCLERMIIDSQIKFVNRFNDNLSQFISHYNARLKKWGGYDKDMMWILNAPFAYNLARYKNLSIEDLFYGNPTTIKLEGVKNQTPSIVSAIKDKYSEGDIVIMSSVQATMRGGLRGIIKGTNLKITISPKSLQGQNIYRYENRDLKVAITRYDENACAYNAEICK